MTESKFLKAYCGKTKRYFALEIKQFGSVWKVVNMTCLPPEDAKLVTSEVEQSHFETNGNLIPCGGCGSRRIGGCDCARQKRRCGRDMGYRFDCVYCDELKIDYAPPAEGDVSEREGEIITLSQGQEVTIRRPDRRTLTEISVGVGWDPAKGAEDMDVDSSVVLLSEDNRQMDLVYFMDKEHETGCVIHHGDNLTGEGDAQDGDDENISVYLTKVPKDRDKLVFVLNIYNCDRRGQTLDKVRNLYIRLNDPNSGKTLIQYRVRGNMGKDTAMVIGVAYRKRDAWTFKAIGQGVRVSDVHALARLCGDFV